ncbi:MAG: hypothetical protein KDN18_18085, partial [Verrucomicrobiae bacterium]|nr:hypothetical protein [Verrucomicrobiae bacterium]
PSGGITAEDLSLNAGARLTGFELYHLRDDPGETRDRGADEPARFAEMRDRLVAKFEEVRSESPVWPEWEFPRYEGQRIEWPPYKALRKPPEHGR